MRYTRNALAILLALCLLAGLPAGALAAGTPDVAGTDAIGLDIDAFNGPVSGSWQLYYGNGMADAVLTGQAGSARIIDGDTVFTVTNLETDAAAYVTVELEIYRPYTGQLPVNAGSGPQPTAVEDVLYSPGTYALRDTGEADDPYAEPIPTLDGRYWVRYWDLSSPGWTQLAAGEQARFTMPCAADDAFYRLYIHIHYPAQGADFYTGYNLLPGRLTGLPYTDVTVSDWFCDAVTYVHGRELMSGTSETAFSPGEPATRSMLVTILHRLAGSPSTDYLMTFPDVDAGSWYGEAVRWAASEGIVTGYGDGSFGPDGTITREQLAVFLWRFAQYRGEPAAAAADLSAYADAGQIHGYAREAMAWAVGAGLISGTSETTLSPGGTATRAQTAAILMRYLEAQP